jgi:hypothetical protein
MKELLTEYHDDHKIFSIGVRNPKNDGIKGG